MATATAGVQTRSLRVAFLWNGSLLGEELIEARKPVILGGTEGLFPLPDTVVADGADVTLLEPTGAGYRLNIARGMGGSIWMGGEEKRVKDIVASGGGGPSLGPDDYGVITLGSIAIFFQGVRGARTPERSFLALDGSLASSFGLSVFLHIAAFILLILAHREMPEVDPLELSTDVIRRFMVTPPPESIVEEARRESGTNTEDPGVHDNADTGGTRDKGEEGRVGHEDAQQENTEIQGENRGEVATKVRQMGLLGVLSGGGGNQNAIASVLDDMPSVSDMLSGTNAANTIVGRGSGGRGLRGTGGGGGGTGPGNLFGAGGVGTGGGVGSGGGLGRGGGGIGAKGRPREEVRVSLQMSQPRVSGYLSPEQINRVVRANQAAIRYCYELQVQRQPNLRGRIEIQWRINLQGSVTTARVESSSMHSADVEGCIVRQIRRWRFDQPDGGEVVVSYPFIFGVQGG
ncbi:MAG: AgmX/PglI C-terminal domain-containing protein [Sandaracinaceae bacterium]|jgi:hypothetical protein|nr:AgmX/PglI C-terminal domain-containing protein [Sandaracinaceae bacterium]